MQPSCQCATNIFILNALLLKAEQTRLVEDKIAVFILSGPSIQALFLYIGFIAFWSLMLKRADQTVLSHHTATWPVLF